MTPYVKVASSEMTSSWPHGSKRRAVAALDSGTNSWVRMIAAIPGNRGVQMLRMVDGGVAQFEVLSYWDSIAAIKRFAGNDYEKVRPLPRDPEYMIGAAPAVRHFEVIVNDWPAL